jgi:hypothetical protein
VLNRDIYWELVSRKMTRPICALKWCTKYEIGDEAWKTIYKQYSIIKDTKLKAFQFKVLNNLLPCNLYLARIGKCKSIKCTQCDEIEDITHYLVNCPVTRNLWDQLSLWWKDLSGQEVVITERDIILGLGHKNYNIVMQDQLNSILMAVKWKIHAKKQMGEDIHFFQIVTAIKRMIETMNFIAIRNGKSLKHNNTWGAISEHIK